MHRQDIFKQVRELGLIALVAGGIFMLGFGGAHAATSANLEVGGWIPYWRDTEGIADARKNIKYIDTLYPFAFSVKTDGTLADLADLSESRWKSLFSYARSRHVELVPTVMWSDGANMQRILSDTTLRTQHIDTIVSMVKKGKYDGVDIDYESKLSATKDSFSLFLKELKEELGSKVLACTIEPRTPPDSLYKVIPTTIEYANDYKAIGEYCDRVELMAYDQRRADIKLNDSKNGAPYVPVADVDWVRKVVELARKDIPADKIILGIPTYGQHYVVTVSPNWYQSYERIGALNIPDILDIADEYDVTSGRNKAGELSFTYFPAYSPYKILSVLPVPKETQQGNEAAAQALLFANATGQTLKFNLAWYSDAEAVADKVKLAKELGLRGVALFKIDGQEDKNIWKLFK